MVPSPAMVESMQAWLDAAIPPVFARRPDTVVPWFYDYFAELAEAPGRRRYARMLAGDLELAGVDLRGKVAVDAGSGFGVTLFCFAALQPRLALGLEAFAPMARSSEVLRGLCGPELPATLVRGSVHEFPLAPGSADFIYCNEALSHFLDPSSFLAECARTLRPGGVLFISDGNNGANPRTAAEVKEVWRRFERGPAAEDFHGHRIEVPYEEKRLGMIQDALPGLAEETARRLAWGTFGLHGSAVIERARSLLAQGTFPDRPRAVDSCPVDPVKGDHIENLIHPGSLAMELRSLGFKVRVHAHFGGARSPWIAWANKLLRAMSPLTLPAARAVKVVAVRR